jgi:membrane protein DedA with SNARE-associated domain
LIAILAEIFGASLVYFSFYFFGSTLKKYRPSWLKIPSKKISLLKLKIINSSSKSLLLFRLIPFIRGYVSVLAGIIHLPQKKYIKVIVISSFLWTGGWILLGAITSKYFKIFIDNFKGVYVVIIVVLFFLLIKFISKIYFKKIVE